MLKFNNFFKVFLISFLIVLKASDIWSERMLRITGGFKDPFNDVPSLVQIFYKGSFICGGTLVSNNFVITAAYCVENKNPSEVTIKWAAKTHLENGIKSGVSYVYSPNTWSVETMNMDIAVLKLKLSIARPSIHLSDICTKKPKHGDIARVYGWGRNGFDDTYVPNNLKYVDLHVVDKKRCEKIMNGESGIPPLTASMFCAAAPGKSTCGDDWGGPVYINGKFCGITSWYIGCATPGFPDVFTDFTDPNVRQFITRYIRH